MTSNTSFSRSLQHTGEDISRCAELLQAIVTATAAELPERLSAIVAAALDCSRGGFHAGAAPAGMPLVEEVHCDGERHGCYAFDAPQWARPRLVSLARLTGLALSQRKQQDDFRQIFNQVYDAVIVTDMAGFITGWNMGAERMLGYPADAAVGRHVRLLLGDDGESGLWPNEFLGRGKCEMEVRRRGKSGETLWVRLSLSHLRDNDGRPLGMVGYLSDITEQVEDRHRLVLHAKIFEQSDEAIVITDRNWRILSVNPAFVRITGHAVDCVLGESLTWLSRDPNLPVYDSIRSALAAERPWEQELHAVRKSGEEFPIHCSACTVVVPGNDERCIIWIFSDISDRQRAEERIHYLAYYDAVTGLPNRSLLTELSEQALANARRDGRQAALMFIDLNRFKPINDSLGHDAGDALLREVGQRLRSIMRDGDVVARIGDDEFVVAMFDHTHSEHSGLVAQRLLATIDVPFMVAGHEVHIGASIGISVFPSDGNSVEALFHNADVALYRAKRTGVNAYVYYSQELNERSLERLKIEAGLRRALENGELVLHYQPKVDLSDGSIIGAEVLVRWQHPEHGLIPPGQFIPVAEESGLVVAIGNWVLEQSCAQARKWHDAGHDPIRVAVNLSARQFGPDLAKGIQDVLLRHDLPADWLELEITESMLMNSAEHVIGMMDDLSELGVSLSLDDFGTGYSSLSYLKRFPIETIKIDRSFVKGIPEDADDCAIAAAIVSMSKQLKLRVIAEGVETDAQMEFMRSLGCDEIQGYLFSPPVHVEEFETMMLAKRKFDA